MSEDKKNKYDEFKKRAEKYKLKNGVNRYFGFDASRVNKYNIPVYCKYGEDLEFLGGHDKGRATMFKGMLLPFSIEHGENFDILEGKFGLSGRRRQIIVSHNQARRQLLTVKIGQYCEVFGEARLYRKEVTKPDGKVVHPTFWGLYAMAINGWYVPRMFDVKKREEDIASGEEKPYGEMTKEKEQYFQNIIDNVFDERINARVTHENDDEDDNYESDIDMGEEEE